MTPNSWPSTGRTTAGGAILWILSLQFFVAQAVVQSAWRTPFSLARNFISDLGNTVCGPYPAGSSTYVCSPWHALMNASFLTIGVTIVSGAILVAPAFRPRGWRVLALGLVALAGPGFILVGMFPENVAIAPHHAGAALNFVAGNLGLALVGVLVAADLRRPGAGAFLVASGVTGLAATALLVTGHFLGAGIGGMERWAAYPLPLGLALTGLVLRQRPRLDPRPPLG